SYSSETPRLAKRCPRPTGAIASCRKQSPPPVTSNDTAANGLDTNTQLCRNGSCLVGSADGRTPRGMDCRPTHRPAAVGALGLGPRHAGHHALAHNRALELAAAGPAARSPRPRIEAPGRSQSETLPRSKHLHGIPLPAARGPDAATVERVGSSAR